MGTALWTRATALSTASATTLDEFSALDPWVLSGYSKVSQSGCFSKFWDKKISGIFKIFRHWEIMYHFSNMPAWAGDDFVGCGVSKSAQWFKPRLDSGLDCLIVFRLPDDVCGKFQTRSKDELQQVSKTTFSDRVTSQQNFFLCKLLSRIETTWQVSKSNFSNLPGWAGDEFVGGGVSNSAKWLKPGPDSGFDFLFCSDLWMMCVVNLRHDPRMTVSKSAKLLFFVH